jgi:predicted N-formylglutamate amidohydrolase
MLEHSYISSAGSLALLVVAISFVPAKLSRRRRVAIGLLHAFAHMTAALILMLLLEFGFEICIRNNLLATSGMV